MNWSLIDPREVLAEFNPAEQSALAAVQGSATTIDEILQRAVNAARGSIEAGGYELDPTASTIPDLIRSEVIAIARWRWLVSLPQMRAMQTTERKELFERGDEKLKKIEAGELNVSPPDPEEEEEEDSGADFGSETKINMRTHTES